MRLIPPAHERARVKSAGADVNFVKRFWPWLAAIVTGVSAAASLPPFDQTWLAWIALVPLTFAILFSGGNAQRRWLRDLGLGYVAGAIFVWIAFFWLNTVTSGGWCAIGFYMGGYFAAWGWFCGLMRPRVSEIAVVDKWSGMLAKASSAPPPSASPWLSSAHNLFFAFALASAWVATEWVRGWLFSGWGWNGLGVALHATWPLIQIAEFTGVAGVTFLVAFVNIIIATTARRLWEETRGRLMKPHFDLTLTLVGLIAVFTFGIHATKNRPATRVLHIAAVQANVPREEKFDPRYTDKIFDKFERLTEIARQANSHLDLIIWPESALPAPVLRDQRSFDFVSGLARSSNIDFLVGSLDVDGDQVFNAAMLFPPDGSVQLYHKIHLVPFGEYVPLRYSFPLFARIAGDQVPEDFSFGRDYTVFQLSGSRGRVAPLICFEDTVGELARQFVLRGAQLLVTVTNDGWFLRSGGSRQHLANAIFRCVELRRPMVRAANTGVTCFVNDLGRVTQILRDDRGSIFEEGTLVGEANVSDSPVITFYAMHGELFAKLCAAIAVAIAVLKLVSRHFARAGQPKCVD